MNKMNAGLLFILALSVATPSLAYIGPGVGGGVIAAVLGIIGAVFLGIVGVLFFPIKRALAARKKKKSEPEVESDLE